MKNVLNNILFILAIWVILPVNTTYAQEVIFKATAAAQTVGIQDPFEVQYRIENVQNVSTFQLPENQQVQILSGPSRNIQYREINGQRSVCVILTYVMKARKKGTLQLDGATAIADGHKFHSNGILINVVDGSTLKRGSKKQANNNYDPFDEWMNDEGWGSDPMEMIRKQQQQFLKQWQQQPKTNSQPIITRADIGKNIFFLVEADKRKVVRGEQINVSYKLYTRLPMEINITKTPDLEGFWSQDFKLPNPPQPSNEIYKGKEYQVFEIKRTAIFPTKTGTLTLDQAKAEGIVRLVQGNGGTNLFDSFLGSLLDENDLRAMGQQIEEIPIQLQSEPIKIEVNELPLKQKPASFQGAVGQFTMDVELNKTEIKQNEDVSLTIQLSGTGNLKLAGIPTIAFPSELNAFEPTITDSMVHTPQFIAGFKRIKYTFTPNKIGEYKIPAISFSYFDPKSNSYQTLSTPTYQLNVVANETSSSIGANNEKNTSSTLIHKMMPFLYRNKWNGLFIALTLLSIVLIILGLQKTKKKTITPPIIETTTNNKKPNQLALAHLTNAERYLLQGDSNEFYQEISKACWLYLSNKLNIPLAQLSQVEAEKKLNQLSLEPSIINELFQITKACETALYSPIKNSLQMHQIYSNTMRLLEQLEASL